MALQQQHSMNPVGYTCQITAAFRAVELDSNPDPIIVDPLAVHLAGEALSTARSDWQALVSAQGAGRSLRVPARNRVVDDSLVEILQAVAEKQGPTAVVQVVNIGCGMDTKPWRLQLPATVHWFDVDQPGVMGLKQQLLQQAGAAITPNPGNEQQASTESDSVQPKSALPAVKFPLLVDSWHPVAADLSEVSLADCLAAAGFKANCLTVWIAEALLYYLPLHNACQLLCDMHSLSGPASKLIATCVDKELQSAHLNLPQVHYFSTSNVSWHFCMDDLEKSIEMTGWQVDVLPRTAADLTRERYNKDVYVALYGGAEYCFTAKHG